MDKDAPLGEIVWTGYELSVHDRNAGRLVSATAARVDEQLRGPAENYETDEVIVNPMVPGDRNRRVAIEGLVRELGWNESFPEP